MGAFEETLDGEGLEFRTPKGEVSLDTVKSWEPVKSKVIGKDCSKLKESAGDVIFVLDKSELTCVVFITRNTPLSENGSSGFCVETGSILIVSSAKYS